MADANSVTVRFRKDSIHDMTASHKEGRPIFKDIEVCDIFFPGDRQRMLTELAHAAEPNATREAGETVTYAQKYNKQYQSFKNMEDQTQSGTPLSELPFLTEGKRRELKALHIHTAEQLAALDGKPLKQLGMGGRDLKSQAKAYLDKASGSAELTALASENEDLRRRLAALEAQASGKHQAPVDIDAEDEVENDLDGKDLDDCTDAELKAYIKEQTGEPVRGNPSRETLIERATELATKA